MSSLLPYNAQQVTVEKLQYNKSADLCYCVMSYVHYHDAVSPAFLEKDYTTHEYSTWVESRYVCQVFLQHCATLSPVLDMPCVFADGGLLAWGSTWSPTPSKRYGHVLGHPPVDDLAVTLLAVVFTTCYSLYFHLLCLLHWLGGILLLWTSYDFYHSPGGCSGF